MLGDAVRDLQNGADFAIGGYILLQIPCVFHQWTKNLKS